MSSEDFINPNNIEHPEVSDVPLEMKHPEQVTLRHLLHEITDKSKDGREYGGTKSTELHYAGQITGVPAIVSRIEKGSSLDDPNRVGRIQLQENVGENGDGIITNYFVLDAPDGLQMEKHTLTSNFYKFVGVGATAEEVSRIALGHIAKIAEMEKAKVMEDELGLSFVSEQEARDLLKLFDNLEVSKKKS